MTFTLLQLPSIITELLGSSGWGAVLARVLLALMFAESAIDKFLHWDKYRVEIVTRGIPLATLCLSAAALVETAGTVSLLSGRAMEICILALIAYVLGVSFIYFNFWRHVGDEASMLRKEFIKNLAVTGGLLACLMMPGAQVT